MDKKLKPGISACLVIKDEELVIERCLKSIEDVVDEIIVVHDGKCSDKSLKICKSYGAKVFERDFFGECAVHRPFTFEKSTHEWVLVIDADEYLSDRLRDNIIDFIKDDQVDAYSFIWPLYDGAKNVTKKWPRKIALLRLDKIYYFAFPDVPVLSRGITKKVDDCLEHKPINPNLEWKIALSKMRRIFKKAPFAWEDYKKIPQYNSGLSDWPLSFKIKRELAILIAPFSAFYHFSATLAAGAGREGVAGWKFALIVGIYNFMLYYYIFLARFKRKS